MILRLKMKGKVYQDFENVLSLYKKAQRIYIMGSANSLLIGYSGEVKSFVKKFEDLGMNVLPSENGLERKLRVMTIFSTDGLSCEWIGKYINENLQSGKDKKIV